MGPSGTDKTFIAAGLCNDAIKHGLKAYFRTMDDISQMLKMKDITRSATADYKRLSKAHLIVIDDIMLFPLEKGTAVSLFNFINKLYESTSFIITTNKAPKQWAQMLDDEVLASALLYRLLYRCEVINLTGIGYRMRNRKTILANEIFTKFKPIRVVYYCYHFLCTLIYRKLCTCNFHLQTNVKEPDWAEFLGDLITTTAILDRIHHHSVIVRIDGPSYRQHQGKLLQKKYANKKSENAESG